MRLVYFISSKGEKLAKDKNIQDLKKQNRTSKTYHVICTSTHTQSIGQRLLLTRGLQFNEPLQLQGLMTKCESSLRLSAALTDITAPSQVVYKHNITAPSDSW